MMRSGRILQRNSDFFCRLLVLGFLLALAFPLPALSTDLDREKELSVAIRDSLVVGEAVTLEAESGSFLALYSAPEAGRNKGVAVLLHGLGGSPVQASVIEPLRTGLPERGWGTLSLQLPILEAGAERIDYYPLLPAASERIKAAVRFLDEKKVEKIALIGHSLGAMMGLSYLAKEPATPVSMAVMIGLFVPTENQEESDVVAMLSKVDRPILDLYGRQDLPIVIKSDRQRREAASLNQFYQQVKIDSANHMFRGLDQLLVARVSGWIGRMAEKTVTFPDKQKEKEQK